MKKIYHILPVFNERIWGGQELIKRYGYKTDLKNIGECYNVIAMPNHLDCDVLETNEKLSAFYHNHKDLFGSDTKEMPVRVAMANPIIPMSVQVHPNDEYALKHDHRLGKPDGVYFIEGEGTMELGHYAKTREEFIEKVNEGDWDNLLRYIPIKAGEFVDVPYGTLHAFGGGFVLIEFSQNADLTYRLYDYDRIDETTNQPRDLHVQKVFECVNIPNDKIGLVDLNKIEKDCCILTSFHDEPGVYSAGHIEVETKGNYERDEFYFLTCLGGEGKVNDIAIKGGETLFIPCEFGPITLTGSLDLSYVTYVKKEL
ncbi:class I mannose-6-phosphate isomerase [Breznakia sp. OttesenSCG-928-G09]|nr:class I mannose-6-phosphate isomerase [Breznakia sp. OttesenSCG-928-G09]